MFCKIKCIIFRIKVQIQLCSLLTQVSFLDKTIIIFPLQALCQVTAIYLVHYLTPSAEHIYLQRLYFQEDGRQVSCFTYKLFMVMLKDFSNHWGYLLKIMAHICFGVGVLLLHQKHFSLIIVSVMNDRKSGAIYTCPCLSVSHLSRGQQHTFISE